MRKQETYKQPKTKKVIEPEKDKGMKNNEKV